MNTGAHHRLRRCLAAAFAAAWALGYGVGPVTSRAQPADHAAHPPGASPGEQGGADGLPVGLQISEGGYSLVLKTPRVGATKKEGDPARLRFAVVRDGTGRNLTSYQREHGKKLHFTVVSRDLTVYRHLHPRMAADGTWSTPADLPEAGGYRVFAGFTPEGASEGLTLGADLAVSGSYQPAGLPKTRATVSVDGYEVTLRGRLRPGAPGDVTLRVARNGKTVRDLEPYLGARGHLVALRSGDLAYLHVVPAQCSAAMPAGVIGPQGSWLDRCPADGTATLACVDLDRTDPNLDIALNKARPWRGLARAGQIYEVRRVADPRSTDRTHF